jgi:hypothetical protein
MKVKPTHYSIRLYYGAGLNSIHLKTWTGDSSNDGTAWIRLDERMNNNELNSANAGATFAISQPQPVHMIRLQQTGPNHSGKIFLVICSFEVFGTLFESTTSDNCHRFCSSRDDRPETRDSNAVSPVHSCSSCTIVLKNGINDMPRLYLKSSNFHSIGFPVDITESRIESHYFQCDNGVVH